MSQLKEIAGFKPRFNSQTLTEAFSEVSFIFDHYQSDINSVSEDISNLENYIASKNVTIPFYVSFGDFALSWANQIIERKFRLLYSEIDPFTANTCDEVVVDGPRPLIEAPLKYRLKAYPRLSDFLREFSKEIKIFHRKKPQFDEPIFSDDEIPF